MTCAARNRTHSSLKWLLVSASLLLVLVLLAHSPCLAAELGLGAYWPGYRGYLTGIVPPKPGLYIRNDTVYYSASIPRVVLNGLPVENAEAEVLVDIVEPMYVLPHKLFGADHAIVVNQTFAWARLHDGIIGTDIHASGNRVAPGDMAVSPLLLGWHKGMLHYNTNLAIFIPTGDYDITRVVNVSRNYWALDPEVGVTYLNPRTGWDLSGAAGYTFNFRNSATDYTSGEVFHLDYAAGVQNRYGFKAGINGFVWLQTTPDTGRGAIFGAFESQVMGIGPALQWKTGENSTLMFRYFNEFWAKNHLQGNEVDLQFRINR